MAWATWALLTALGAGPAGVVDDDAQGLTLRWEAPAGCPDSAHVRGRVAALLGPDAAAADGVSADAVVTQEGDAYRLTLRVASQGAEEGERTLEGASCEEVADAAAFIVAIAIDPDAVAASPIATGDPDPDEALEGGSEPGDAAPEDETPSVPEPPVDPAQDDPAQPEPEPESPPKPEPPREPADSRRAAADSERSSEPRRRGLQRPGFNVAAQVGPGFGITAPVGFDVAASFALAWRRLWLEARATYRAPRSVTAPTLDTIEGRFQRVAASLRACGVVLSVDRAERPAAVVLPLCAGLEAGAIFGTGGGSLRSGQGAAPWAGAIAGPTLAWRPAQGGRRVRVGLRASAEVVVGFVRSTFETEQGRTILETGVLGGQVLAGLEVAINPVR